jgi:hypothetical protein
MEMEDVNMKKISDNEQRGRKLHESSVDLVPRPLFG